MSTAASPDPLGAELKRVRDSLGLTLVQFGELTGIPWNSLHAYETGRATPPADRFLAIVHAGRRATPPFRFERVARVVAGLVTAERAAA